MMATKQLHNQARSVIASFETILTRDKRLDADFSTMNSKIEAGYKNKISQLEVTRKQVISSASTQVQHQQQQLKAVLAELTKIEGSIPQEYKKKYRNTATTTLVPKAPDFRALSEMVARINDTTISGRVKRVLQYDGYTLRSEMVNTFLDDIESARIFINEENQKWVSYLSQVKAQADQDFQREKIEADRKKSTYKQQNRQQYDSASSNLRAEFEKLISSSELPQFDAKLLSAVIALGAFEEGWDKYAPAESYPSEVMLGAIDLPLILPAPANDLVKQKMPVAYASGRSITLPFSAGMNEPIYLTVTYDDQQKERVMTGIQSIILKLIRFMPPFSFNLTYIDPNDRGTNLGLLQKLSSITSADLHKEVYASKEGISKRLKELETFVDKTSAELAGVEDVYRYNAIKEAKITYNLVVINDYPAMIERDAAESLAVLIQNARKCGISFIFTSSKGTLSSLKLPANISINAKNNGTTLTVDGRAYDFVFDGVVPTCGVFLEEVRTVYSEGIQIDNRFSVFFKPNESGNFLESTYCMCIPFAVDSTKHLIQLELGGAQSAHALLSGRTGSGKSTTLHMFITSIVLNYHPDDVELWLIDYKKVEFAEYINCCPPHVKLIGLERSPEFTYSLLDKIDEEFQRRLELFKTKGVNTITEYKERYGVNSLPRIILIIDEFHQMTQAIKNEPHYVQILENILSEYRVFGLSCVFSDQAISDGLRGLTEKGRKQISIRIAMENDISEIRETLALDNSLYDDALKNKIMRMSKGDVVFKRFDENGEIVLDRYKTILVTRDERVQVIALATKKTKGCMRPKEVLIVDGQKRIEFEEEQVREFEQNTAPDSEQQIPIYVGTPANLNPCFFFNLRKKTDSNIMIIGSDDELRASVLLHVIYSFKRASETNVMVFAYQSDELYHQCKDQIEDLLDKDDEVITNISKMGKIVSETLGLLCSENQKRTLICWLGLEELADEFSLHNERSSPGVSKSTGKTSISDVDLLISEMDAILKASGDSSLKKASEDSKTEGDVDQIYDARPDIQELFTKGSRYGIFSLVTYPSVKQIRQTKFLKTENFEHKIAFRMSMDDSSSYLGKGSYASGLDAITAVYDDGSGSVKSFRPYII